MKSPSHPAIFIIVQEVAATEASTEEWMGIGTQILSKSLNVRMNVREEESAEFDY